MEPLSEREEAIRRAIYDWARTAGELRALGQWTIAQADALEALNEPVYTERQEYRRCGKARCTCATGPGHGPYVYRYWTAGGKTRREYVGKPSPADSACSSAPAAAGDRRHTAKRERTT